MASFVTEEDDDDSECELLLDDEAEEDEEIHVGKGREKPVRCNFWLVTHLQVALFCHTNSKSTPNNTCTKTQNFRSVCLPASPMRLSKLRIRFADLRSQLYDYRE